MQIKASHMVDKIASIVKSAFKDIAEEKKENL